MSYETGRLVLCGRETGPVGQGELSSCGAGRLVLWVGAGRVVILWVGAGRAVILWGRERCPMGHGDWCCRAGRVVLCGGAGRVVMWGRDKWYCGAGRVVLMTGMTSCCPVGQGQWSCRAGTVVMTDRDNGPVGIRLASESLRERSRKCNFT